MSAKTKWATAMRRVDAARLAFASVSEFIAYRLIVSNRQPTEAERAEWTSRYNAWHDAIGESHALLQAERAEVAQ